MQQEKEGEPLFTSTNTAHELFYRTFSRTVFFPLTVVGGLFILFALVLFVEAALSGSSLSLGLSIFDLLGLLVVGVIVLNLTKGMDFGRRPWKIYRSGFEVPRVSAFGNSLRLFNQNPVSCDFVLFEKVREIRPYFDDNGSLVDVTILTTYRWRPDRSHACFGMGPALAREVMLALVEIVGPGQIFTWMKGEYLEQFSTSASAEWKENARNSLEGLLGSEVTQELLENW